MKKSLLFLGIVAMLSAFGCKDYESYDQPQITLSQEENDESITFSVTAPEAQKLSYMLVESAQREPSPSSVLNEGTSIESGENVVFDYGTLNPETGYVLYVAAKNGMYGDFESAEFVTPAVYDLDLDCTNGFVKYWGDYYSNGNGYYMLDLGDESMESDGIAHSAGSISVNLFLAGEKAEDSDFATLSPGVYYYSDSYERYGLISNASFLIPVTSVDEDGVPHGYKAPFYQGMVDVSMSEDSVYTIEADLRLEEGDYSHVHVTYSGKLECINSDPNYYTPLKEDIDTTFTKGGGVFTVSSSGEYGIFNLSLFSTPVDEYGFIIGAGDVFAATLLVPYTEHFDASKLPGTYSILPYDSEEYEPGTFLSGTYESLYGMYMPMGTYYERIYSDFSYSLSLITDGTITLEIVNDSTLYVKAELVTMHGNTINIESTFDLSEVSDYTNYGYDTRSESSITIRPLAPQRPEYNVKSIRTFNR
jgi:hypothetical protein